MNDKHKLYAFIAVLSAMVLIAMTAMILSRFTPPISDLAMKLADSAMTIMGTAFGAAALALFRSSQATDDMASALKTQAETQASITPPTAATVLQPGEAAVASSAPLKGE